MTPTSNSPTLFVACLRLLYIFVLSSIFGGFCLLLDVTVVQGVLSGGLPTRGPEAFAIFTGVAGTHLAVVIFSSVAFVRVFTMHVHKHKKEEASDE